MQEGVTLVGICTDLLAGARIKPSHVSWKKENDLRKSCLVFAEHRHVSLKVLRNVDIERNEPLCFSVSRALMKCHGIEEKVFIWVNTCL